MDLAEAKKREEIYDMEEKGSYMYFFNYQDKKCCVDATAEVAGRYGRLINHSKTNPNCITKVVSYNNRPRLILVAKSLIKINSELLFDYGRNWLKFTSSGGCRYPSC